MRRAWKIALPVMCFALIGGAMALELMHRLQLEQQSLAQEAEAYGVRAEKGEAEAEYEFGREYSNGRGVPQNYAEALRWYRKAADQNLAKAQYDVGYSYYYGYGVGGDFTEALRWFHLAANQNDPGAENEIGISYEVGNGVTVDYNEAARWYRLAADHGYATAEYNLGRMYAYGYGIARDRVRARELITKAANQGYRPAKQMLGRSWPALNTAQKIQLITPLIVGILFILPSRGPSLESRPRFRRSTRFVGLGLIFSAAFSLLSFTYAGILQPPLLVGAFGFARNLVGGVIVSILLQIVLRNSAKWSLWGAGFLFIVLNGVFLARCFDRVPTDTAVRLLISVNGMPLGLGITSAVLLLRARRGGETGGPPAPDAIADAKSAEPAHS
jgi:hypothetical protein